MNSRTVRASDYIAPSLSIVECANHVAHAVIERLTVDEVVTISLVGVRGASSSFFNVILQDVSEALGVEVLSHRLNFEFDSGAQETLYKRSLDKFVRSPS